MTPKQVAAVLMIIGWLCLAMAFLTSCVAVPVPPFGTHLGEAGTLHIKAVVRFEPRLSEGERENANLLHALSQYQNSLPAWKDK